METTAVDFDVGSLYDGCNISIEHAFTIKVLPDTKACIPYEPVLKRWQHLSDVKPIRIPGNRVDLLLGTNVSEAHWIFEQRRRAPKDPYAYLTTLERMVLGQVVNAYSKSTLALTLIY